MKPYSFLAMAVLATSAYANNTAWRFDFNIDGPRDARPQVHGDANELFFQFPAEVKPGSFTISGCGSKSYRVKPELRGPYYVIKSQGEKISIGTNKGTITVTGEKSCPQSEAKAAPLVQRSEPSKTQVVHKSADQTKTSTKANTRVKTQERPTKNKSVHKTQVEHDSKRDLLPEPAPIENIHVWTLRVNKGESLKNALTRQLKSWNKSLSWNLGRDRVSNRDFVFNGESPEEIMDQVLQAFDLRGWYASNDKTLYITKESD